MKVANNATYTKRALMIRLIKDFFKETLEDNIDRIPVEMRPKKSAATRCCVYKDRVILKYRLMAMLGFSVYEETDEIKPLKEYLQEALKRTDIKDDSLSVLDIACSQCKTGFMVTNACKGCFARPCAVNCPVNAITIQNCQATIDADKCIRCGKCVNFCAYKAIIKVPVPCEDACPVDAIKRNPENQEQYIDYNACINCGKCMEACPFEAVLGRSQLVDVMQAIKAKKKVVAMIAPAISDQFSGDIGQIAAGLLECGFTDVVEVALGAEETTEHEVDDFIERMKNGQPLMTTSCCPAFVKAVELHVPELKEFISEAKTPMQYTAHNIKAEDKDAITVFFGPCIAKKEEAKRDGSTDFVLTFEELGAMFAALEIDTSTIEPVKPQRDAEDYARGFSHSCGVKNAVLHKLNEIPDGPDKPEIKANVINGLDKKAIKLLGLHAKGKLPGNFLEVMACQGGCASGPCSIGKIKLPVR